MNPETINAALSRAKPLVWVEDGYFVFYLDGEPVYDFQASDAAQALRWAEHMAKKSWVTKLHLEQYAHLAAIRFGGGY